MKCFRRLNPIQVISFDLDDTLYDNTPIIVAAEQAQLDFLHQHVPASRHTNTADWAEFRHQLLKQQPQLRHDVGELRRQTLYHQLRKLGESEAQSKTLVAQAFEVFHQQRKKVTIESTIITLLQQLSQHYPLIALTNGNACIQTMGLGEIFEFAILAGEQGIEQKPSPQMFDHAANKLGVNNKNILHIGDSQPSDIQGALNANCMAVWYNPDKKPATNGSPLPHVEINEISQLSRLLHSN